MNDRTDAERDSYRPSIMERFWSYVDKSGGPDACWPWLGYKDARGYGKFRADTIGYLPHRWLLGMLRGAPLAWRPDLRESACHHCDNPPCCNPAHLYVGDPHSNMMDSVVRGRHFEAAKTHCLRGHPLSGPNLYVQPSTGGRMCRTCRRASNRERQTAARRAAS